MEERHHQVIRVVLGCLSFQVVEVHRGWMMVPFLHFQPERCSTLSSALSCLDQNCRLRSFCKSESCRWEPPAWLWPCSKNAVDNLLQAYLGRSSFVLAFWTAHRMYIHTILGNSLKSKEMLRCVASVLLVDLGRLDPQAIQECQQNSSRIVLHRLLFWLHRFPCSLNCFHLTSSFLLVDAGCNEKVSQDFKLLFFSFLRFQGWRDGQFRSTCAIFSLHRNSITERIISFLLWLPKYQTSCLRLESILSLPTPWNYLYLSPRPYLVSAVILIWSASHRRRHLLPQPSQVFVKKQDPPLSLLEIIE